MKWHLSRTIALSVSLTALLVLPAVVLRCGQALGGEHAHAAAVVARHPAAVRQARLREALARRGIDSLGVLDILEVGCGTGGELTQLVALGADPRP